MATSYTYPGVYIEEVKSQVHTISGVATSITAFVGYTASGRDNFATRLFSFPDFERNFGGLASDSELSYAVQQFFLNGGSDAYVVRVPRHNAVEGEIAIEDTPGGSQVLLVTALSAGNGAKNVIVDVDYEGIAVADTQSFNLTVTDLTTGTIESFPGVTIDSTGRNFVATAVNDDTTGSKLVRVSVPPGTTTRPAESGTVGGDINLASLGNANNFTLNVSGSLSATGAFGPVLVPFINAGETIPASIIDVCRLLERRANAALQKLAPNARITLRCTPSSSGIGIRVRAFVPADVAGQALDTEITFTAGAPHNVAATLQLTSATVNVAHYVLAGATAAGSQVILTAANAGVGLPQTGDLIGDELAATGVYALSKIDLFNILCIPDATRSLPGNPSSPDTTVDTNAIYDDAEAYCQLRRAFLLIDPPPNVNDVSSGYAWKSAALTVHDDNAAAYFPRLKLPDPLNSFHLRTFAPCGVIAGLYARIDAARGVWKAPAGVEAVLQNVQDVVYKLTDPENGALNPIGLNCLRVFPIYGPVAWGARTLVGSDAEGSEWKYVPVRRMALFLEETLSRATMWVVFEPNDEPLWSQIRLNLTSFMMSLFRQGAFQGTKPSEAFFVKCDNSTTTQDDINRGIVNILVGFAPLKPAEFVVIKISQIAGQV